jgi:hypothetical protein
MRCYNHSSSDAVGVCSCCGKAICKACASEGRTGRLFCSSQCANGPLEKSHFITGCFLLGFGGFLVVLAIYASTRQAFGLGIVMVLYALGCLLAGSVMVQQDRDPNDSFTPFSLIEREIRWRAGIALHESHKFQKKFSEILTLYSRLSGQTYTVSQIEEAEASARKKILEQLCSASGNFPCWAASSAQEAGTILDERVRLANEIGWKFFAKHDARNLNYVERNQMLMELISYAFKMDPRLVLSAIKQGLKNRISEAK